MMGPLPLTAVVVAGCGGARLARALASLEFAAQRIVLDPAARLAPEALPAGVGYVRDAGALRDLVSAPWVLVLAEGETASADLGETLAPLVAEGAPPACVAVRRSLRAFGSELRLLGGAVRLAPSAHAELDIGRGLWPELRAQSLPRRRLGAGDVVLHLAALDELVDELEGDGAAIAALLDAAGQRPRLWWLLAAPVAAGATVLCSLGRSRRRFARWNGAVVLAYRSVVVYAKLWERRYAAGEPTW